MSEEPAEYDGSSLRRLAIGKARSVSTEIKAAFLVGMFNGSKYGDGDDAIAFREQLKPHAFTAALIAFGDGAFNPIAVWEMEAFYDRIVDNCEEAGK